jgi:hypothetical protein
VRFPRGGQSQAPAHGRARYAYLQALAVPPKMMLRRRRRRLQAQMVSNGGDGRDGMARLRAGANA